MSKEMMILTGEKDIQESIETLLNLAAEVPWGNSDFQNRQAIVNAELTPERAYRHASLRIMNRLQALNECYFSLRKEEIQLERLRRKLNFGDDLDKQETQIEIEQIESRRPHTEKLIRDAVREIESLAPVIQSMGKLTREQFEAAEPEHFRLRYHNQAIGKNESLIGLEHMGVELKTWNMLPDHKSLFEKITGQDVPRLAVHQDNPPIAAS